MATVAGGSGGRGGGKRKDEQEEKRKRKIEVNKLINTAKKSKPLK